MCVILLSAALVWATPDYLVLSAQVKGADRRSVKVLLRRAREHTVEKTIHTYIYISQISIEHYL